MILEYRKTSEGKAWFNSVLEEGDKEERLAHILGTTTYFAKCHLRLLRPGNEQFAKMLDTESMHAAITALNEAEEQSGKRKPKDKGPAVTSDGGKRGSEGTTSSTTAGNDTSDSDGRTAETEDELPGDAGHNGPDDTDTATKEEEPEILNWEEIQNGKRQNTLQEDERQASRFIKKVCAVLSDDSQIDIAGIAMLTVDGNEIKSTERLAKHPNGHWMLPNHEKFCLIVQPTI